MKMNSKNITPILPVYLFAATIVFTSCSDDANDANNVFYDTQSVEQSNSSSNGTFFSYGDTDKNNIAVRLNGNTASISRGTSANAVSGMTENATVTYTDSTGTKGYLTINDNSLGVEKVPFLVVDDLMQLNFSENKSLYGGGLVYLDREKVASRAASSNKDSKADENLCSSILTSLLKNGASAVGSKLGGMLFNEISEKLFPSMPDMTQQKLNELDEEIKEIGDAISRAQLANDMANTSNEYNKYWNDMHTLHAHCEAYIKYINMHQNNPELVKEDINEWGNACIGNTTYQVGSSLRQHIESCFNNADCNGHTWYNILDKYVFYSHDWESEGYKERDLLRSYDLMTYIESLCLLRMYYEQKNLPEMSNDVVDFFNNTVLDKFEKQSSYPRHENLAICQIPGAYIVMEKTSGKKEFGTQENYGNGGTVLDGSNDSYFEHKEGEWPKSYIFSQDPIRYKKQELFSKCLTPAEAKTLYNKYSNEYGSLFDILSQKVGITGLDDKNAIMILGTYPSLEWSNDGWFNNFIGAVARTTDSDKANVKIKAHVWENAKNKYNNGYTVDDITTARAKDGIFSSLKYRFTKHNGGWAYYTNVKYHYKNFDDLMKFEKEI